MTSVLTDTHLRAMHGQPGTAVTVSFTDTSAATASALTQGVTYLVQANQDCHILVAASPTATTSHTPIFAGIPYLFTMADASMKMAAIRNEVNGTLFITPLSAAHKQ